jgi:hypothetical protein
MLLRGGQLTGYVFPPVTFIPLLKTADTTLLVMVQYLREGDIRMSKWEGLTRSEPSNVVFFIDPTDLGVRAVRIADDQDMI